MSLIVWLPLNGNLENQGLSNVTVTNNGATVDSNGKIGKCYAFDGSNNRIYTSNLNLDCSKLSLACWFYRDNSSTAEGYIASLNNGSGYVDCAIGLNTSNATTLVFVAGGNSSLAKTFTANQWHHAVVTFNGSTITGYLDGEKVGTSTGTPLTKTLLTIGARANSTAGAGNAIAYPFKGKINDFRIYDHCLSEKEVKELAKGLVLHYRLAGPGRPNLLSYQKIVKQNNVSFSYDASTLTFTTKTPTTATCYGIRMNTDNCIIPWNHVGIMSMDILSPVATTFYRDDNDYAVSGNSWSGNDNTTRGSIVTAIPANKWTKIIIYSINNSSLNTNHESVKVQSSFNINTANVEFKFKNVKFEVSPISTDRNVTSWCPASDDPLYTALGYNNNVEYDCSGYRRNGTKSGTITWDIDSPRYATSYKFGSNTSKIKLPAFNMSGFANSYTFSWWQYNIGSNNMPWGFSDGNRLNPYHTGNLCWNTGDGGSNPFVPNIISSTLYNTWHHIVITGNGTDTKLYIDGEYKGKATTYKGLTGTQIYLSGWDIGTSYTMTGSREADFRIYATALSAEDIAELYHSAVIVDNTGKSYAYEYFEAR